jgi:hypothetical protein
MFKLTSFDHSWEPDYRFEGDFCISSNKYIHITNLKHYLFKGIFRQNNDKNIKMFVCTQIMLKWLFLKFEHEFLFKFYTFWGWRVNISIYVEQNLDANRIIE